MNKKAVRENSRSLDQFYTNPKYAEHVFNVIKSKIDLNIFDVLLEPSAGSGSFFNLFDKKKRIGLDLDPKSSDIIKLNFFDWQPPKNSKIIAIGNPPFGKNSSLAIKFFQRCAEYSDVIAFIVPKTFRKASVINRLNKKFHIIHDEEVPKNSFIFNEKVYNVPCCLQIWIKDKEERDLIKRYSFNDVKNWFIITSPDNADFSIQRVGQKAGTIKTKDFKHYSQLSHYYIKMFDPKVLEIFNMVDFNSVKYNTAGNPSVSPSELIEIWLKKAKELGLNG